MDQWQHCIYLSELIIWAAGAMVKGLFADVSNQMGVNGRQIGIVKVKNAGISYGVF